MTRRFRYVSANLTHVGLVRKQNEDACLVREDLGLWLVADGMGGHENGRWASATVVAAADKVRLRGPFGADVQAVEDAMRIANGTIFETAERSGSRMGSTVAILLIGGDRFACLWSGDSRIYRVRAGRLKRLTHDHSQVQSLVDRGLLRPEEASNHPMANVISHAVGVEAPLWLDTVVDEVVVGDVFMLCSDGLSGVVTDREIAEHLDLAQPATANRRLLELAMSRGAPDNVTIVTVGCKEMTALRVAAEC